MQNEGVDLNDEVSLISTRFQRIQPKMQNLEAHSDAEALLQRIGVLAPEDQGQIDDALSKQVVALLTSAVGDHSLIVIFVISVFVIAVCALGRAAIKNVGSSATQVQGTLLVIAAALTFGFVALIIKSNPLPTLLAVEARFFISWLFCICFMLRSRSERTLNWFGPPKIRWRIVLRGCLTYTFVIARWAALPLAPLGDCTAIVYCGPLMTSALSRVLLREKMPVVLPVQALLALTGMCLILQPPWLVRAFGANPPSLSDDVITGYHFAVIAMINVAFIPIVTNQTKEASWIEVEHVTCFLASFVLNPIAICSKHLAGAVLGFADVGKTVYTMWGVVIIVVAALGSFAGEAMQTRGYQIAEPGKAVMFRYLELPFSYLLQCVATDNPISLSAGIGGILAGLSCVLGAVVQIRSSSEDTNLD